MHLDMAQSDFILLCSLIILIGLLIGFRYYNWAVAAPMILSVQAFQKTLPKVGWCLISA